MNKRQLRSHLRKTRNAVPALQRRVAGQSMLRVAKQEKLLIHRRNIGFYLPFEGEIDLMPLLNYALWLGKVGYLPIVPKKFQKLLKFSRLTNRKTWYLNRFGIHEHWSPRQIRARQLDLLFVPLVGFDEHGYRLGMGGGFYDSSLAYLRRRKVWRKPILVGVGYECQKVASVPRDPWDMPLDAVITEKKLYRFSREHLPGA